MDSGGAGAERMLGEDECGGWLRTKIKASLWNDNYEKIRAETAQQKRLARLLNLKRS